MSTDPQKKGLTEIRLPLHDDVSFEEKDVRTGIILKFLVGLAITLIVSYVATVGIYKGLTNYWESTYAAPPPSRGEEPPTLPPEPRLQGMPGHMTDPQEDWRNMVKADAEANNKLDWTDEKTGMARIPVKEAMDLIVEKGLPALPAMPDEKK
jgi:hypothetical protein